MTQPVPLLTRKEVAAWLRIGGGLTSGFAVVLGDVKKRSAAAVHHDSGVSFVESLAVLGDRHAYARVWRAARVQLPTFRTPDLECGIKRIDRFRHLALSSDRGETFRAAASRSRVLSEGLRVFPDSSRFTMGWATPARRASSAWDQPRRSRSSRIRKVRGVIGMQSRIWSALRQAGLRYTLAYTPNHDRLTMPKRRRVDPVPTIHDALYGLLMSDEYSRTRKGRRVLIEVLFHQSAQCSIDGMQSLAVAFAKVGKRLQRDEMDEKIRHMRAGA